MYDPMMVQPMRDELTKEGFKELTTAADVDALMEKKQETSLIFINSVCGCAAGVARPSVIASLQNEILPQNLSTAFAGNDVEAVERAREYCIGYAPSSPAAVLFRNGELVHMVERHQIEGQTVEDLTRILTSVYDRYCGPEINESVEIYDPMAGLQITAEEARQRISNGQEVAVLDVREAWEAEAGQIDGASRVDDDLGRQIVTEWPREREIIIYCQHGERSLRAVQFLKQQGFQNVRSLAGGYEAWKNA